MMHPPQIRHETVNAAAKQNKKSPARHKAEDDYLLTTKLFCGNCQSLMVGECGTSHTGSTYHYYKCVSAKKRTGCHKKAVKKDWIEGAVVTTAKNKLEDVVFIDDVIRGFMEMQTAENTVIPHLRHELGEVMKSIDNLLKAIEMGIITPSTKQRLEKLEVKRKEIETAIAKESMTRPMLTEDEVRFWFERLRNPDMREPSHRKRLIEIFVNTVFAFDDYLLITFNYPTTTQIVRSSDIDAAFGGSDMVARGRPFRAFITDLTVCI